MSATKISENTINVLKLLLFTINLQFVTSIEVSTYRKLNLPLASNIYNFFLPLEIQKDSNRTKYTTCFLTMSEKKRPASLYKWQLHRTLSPVCVLYVQLAPMNAFIPCYHWNILLFMKNWLYTKIFFKSHVAAFFEASVLKEFRILCVFSTITI